MTYFFFFSSRRRHTRYIGDWSSDVCSSDLIEQLERLVVRLLIDQHRGEAQPRQVAEILRRRVLDHPLQRSEERRVGKECRSRLLSCEEDTGRTNTAANSEWANGKGNRRATG